MARSKLDDLTGDELLVKLAEAKDDLFKLRFQHATGQLTNYRRLGQVRREVARVLTRLRTLEIAEAEALDASRQETR
jgi:large subunit ribosomal protein L29